MRRTIIVSSRRAVVTYTPGFVCAGATRDCGYSRRSESDDSDEEESGGDH